MPKKAQEITVRLHEHQLSDLNTVAKHDDWDRSRALRAALTYGLPIFHDRSPDLFKPPLVQAELPTAPPARRPPKARASGRRAKTTTTPRKSRRK
jgi:hypothetical protein